MQSAVPIAVPGPARHQSDGRDPGAQGARNADHHPARARHGESRGRLRLARIPVRLRERVRDRGAARCAAGRAELAAALPIRAVRRADLRNRVHRAAPREPPHLVLSHPPRRAPPAVQARSTTACSRATSSQAVATPNQLRWDPLPIPTKPTDFVQGLVTMAGNGGPEAQGGCGIHVYAANRSMTDRFFSNADGELLIVPQQGRLRLATEMGLDRRRAAGDRRRPARRALPRRAASTARPAATSARTSARHSSCPTSA